VTFQQFRSKSGRPKLTNWERREATARDISADHYLFIRVAPAKRRRGQMVWETTYSGAGGATPGAGPRRETLALIGDSKLNDVKWYVKNNTAHPETFSEIFEGLEFKWPFKKQQVVENFGRSLEGSDSS
jgi:hypothetical protein